MGVFKIRNWKLLRTVTQLSLVGLVAFLGIRHQVLGGGPAGAAPLDSFCVFGGVETLFSWFTTGNFLAKTNTSNFILLMALLLSVVFVGSAFCGWLCPLGAIQEWLAKFQQKVFKRKITVPVKLDHALQYLKYPVFLLIIFMTVRENTLWFENYDPFKVLFHFNFETSLAYWVLLIFLALSLLVERFWCKYLCPVAAIIHPLSKLSIFKLKRDKNLCVNCNACNPTCSMGKQQPGVQGVFTDACTMCLDCAERCRAKNALGLRLGTRTFGLKSKIVLPIAILAIFSLIISISAATGWWQTKTVVGAVQLTSTGTVSIDDLKGWMTWADVSERYKKPIPKLLQGLGWELNTPTDVPLKDLAKQKDTDFDSIRSKIIEIINQI
ncbi:MAG TPA: 4Fe-4S binding protein [Verrucomicrobiae bacterium]|nr:4Fe-4S binding protein [Verrucomicrobiae bacterium]